MKLWFLLFCFALTSIFAIGGNVIIVSGPTTVSLPQSGNRKLDFNPAISANINAGSPADGDAVSTLVDTSSNAYSFTQGTGANQFTYETNELNGKPIFRMSSGDRKVVNTAATGILAAGTPFTILAVAKVADFTDNAYRYLFNAKGAAAGDSPSWAYSNNGSYQDVFFGCNTTFLNLRLTSITTTSWNWTVLTYSGSGGTTIGNYTGYSGGSSKTVSSSGSNAGTTNNVFGSFTSGSGGNNSFRGDVARFVIWNVVLSAGELTTLASYISQEYAL